MKIRKKSLCVTILCFRFFFKEKSSQIALQENLSVYKPVYIVSKVGYCVGDAKLFQNPSKTPLSIVPNQIVSIAYNED